jgi:hypothetical protein
VPLVGFVHVHGPFSREDVKRREPQILDPVHRPALVSVGLPVLSYHGGRLLIPVRQGLDGHPARGRLLQRG